MSAIATSRRQPVTKSALAWNATLILIPIATAAMLLWLRHVQVEHLAGRNLGRYGSVPEFRLLNQDGQPFGLTQLRGRIWIADFIYTSCPGPCPIISTRVAELQRPLSKTDVGLVSFSVDPEKDTPAVLRTYADKLKADPARWNFLTGPKQTIYALTRDAFKLGVSDPTDGSGDPIHSTRVVLVDRQGVIRGYYDALAADGMTKLLADTHHLMREQPE
ncbi:MAG: SCO family protein [Chthoniobacterales bacterium]